MVVGVGAARSAEPAHVQLSETGEGGGSLPLAAPLATPPTAIARLRGPMCVLLFVVLGLSLAVVAAVFPLPASPPSSSTRPASHAAGPSSPTPTSQTGRGAADTGRYRNVFVEAGLAEPAAVSARVDAIFSQLFFGNKADEAVFFEVGDGSAFISGSESRKRDDVRTEGMSYGMMITAQRGNQSAFDALWRWAQSHMRHSNPRSPYYGYFAWSCKQDGTHNFEGPASDGEIWFAAALYTAAGRFSEPAYARAADELLDDVVFRERTPPVTRLFETSTGVESAPVQVTFVPEGSAAGYTDPSYHVPAFFELFRRRAQSAVSRAFWADAVFSSRNLLQRAGSTPSGLAPDKSEFDGTPIYVPNLASPNFGADAWRVAQNHAMDHLWFDGDARHARSCTRILAFFARENRTFAGGYGDEYSVFGERLRPYHPQGLVAMNAACALAVDDDALTRPFVEELWRTPTPTGEWRYYNGLLYMLAYLLLSGGFRYFGPPSPD